MERGAAPIGRPDAATFELAAIVESSDDAIVGQALDGTVRSWNPAAERIFGYTAAEMIGSPIFRLIPPELHDEVRQILARVRAGEGLARSEMVRLRKDGERLAIMLTVSPVRDAGGEVVGAMAIGRDVTPQRHVEAQLRQAQKMEVLGQLAGGVAHDFNNILTIISGFTAFLGNAIGSGSSSHPDLLGIQQATARASRLTQQLLAFSRYQPTQLEVVDLSAVVAETAAMLRPLLGERIQLDLRLDAQPAWTHADHGQLSQILLNLAVNARDAMPEGGVLTVRVFDDAPADQVVLTVRDTGHGMDARTRARLFEPFFTTKSRGDGTGLGLTTVFGIVRKSGGQIEVDTAPGRGTAFRVRLPRAMPAGRVSEPRATPSVRGQETVLVVDDEPQIAELAARVLLDLGYTVVQATGPGAAMVAFAERNAQVDLVLTDVTMPAMTGHTLVERLRRSAPELAVLYMSGYSDPSTEPGVDTRTDRLIPKPFTPSSLAEAVRGALDAAAARSGAQTGRHEHRLAAP